MKNKLKKLFLCCLVTIVSHQTFAQNVSKDELVKQGIEDIMAKYKAVGLGVAVVKEGKLIYDHSFGFNDLETSRRLAPNDIFRIASISKSFSATAIMQLVAKNKLHLDDDFGKLIGFDIRNPKYPDQVITLRMVLSHTSSINDSEGYFSLDGINPSKNPNWAKCYNDYAPGKGYQYCNLNFNMVGAVIEKTTGERFDQYIKHHILDPLQLYGGYCVDSLDKTKFVTLYELDPNTKAPVASPDAYNSRSEELKNYRLGYSTPILSPTGGMKISSVDLAKYMTMHMNYGKYPNGRIIPKSLSKQMQTKLSDKENYGLALLNTDSLIEGEHLVGHTGSAYGLYSSMFFNPHKKFGIVVITNGCNATYTKGFLDIMRDAYQLLYQTYIK